MKTMTWEEIDKDWNGLQKRHRMEIAQAVARYCIGHTISEVADHLGYSRQWVREQLDWAGVGIAVGGGEPAPSLTGGYGEQRSGEKAVGRLIAEFAPNVTVKTTSDGKGGEVIESVSGGDAEEFQPYLDHYVDEGHTPATAARLAKAEWAGEAAMVAGVIKEDKKKSGERVNRILFPDDERDTFELNLQHHMARVEAAARFLNDAKMNFLRRKSTCMKVASANAKWLEQVERIRNLHPTFDKVV